MKTIVLILSFFVKIQTAQSFDAQTCKNPSMSKAILLVVQSRINEVPIPKTFQFLSANEMIRVPGLCCVTFSAEAVYDKPGCPAYRTICVAPESLNVVNDSHTYNGWCDY